MQLTEQGSIHAFGRSSGLHSVHGIALPPMTNLSDIENWSRQGILMEGLFGVICRKIQRRGLDEGAGMMCVRMGWLAVGCDSRATTCSLMLPTA